MNINLTLVVQAVHFFIAYAIIKHLMLKPILKHIEQEDGTLTALHKRITHAENLVAEQEQLKIKQWRDVRSYFSKHTAQSPRPQERILPLAQCQPASITAQETAAATEALTQELAKAIIHE